MGGASSNREATEEVAKAFMPKAGNLSFFLARRVYTDSFKGAQGSFKGLEGPVGVDSGQV